MKFAAVLLCLAALVACANAGYIPGAGGVPSEYAAVRLHTIPSLAGHRRESALPSAQVPVLCHPLPPNISMPVPVLQPAATAIALATPCTATPPAPSTTAARPATTPTQASLAAPCPRSTPCRPAPSA